MENNTNNNKVFTRAQFERFLIDNDYEAFSARQVKAFTDDVVQKSEKGEMDEFDKSCARADLESLEVVTVLDESLKETPMFVRPSQTEVIPGKPGIFKSISENPEMRRYKETELNIFKGTAGMCLADNIEKARKGEPIGTVKTWSGKEYVKTANGWVHRQGIKTKETAKTEEKKGVGKKFPSVEDLVKAAAKKGHNPKEAEGIIKERYSYLKKKYPEATPSRLVSIAYTIS